MNSTAMPATLRPCSRCLYRRRPIAGARFCPRCGLADVGVEVERSPLEIVVAGEQINVRHALAYGDICNVYRCTIRSSGSEGVFKIARDCASNRHVTREAMILAQLLEADEKRFAPFLPRCIGTIDYGQTNGERARAASLLRYHPGICGPDELYSLEEVRAAYPSGIDARDMAWMWRRLLSILGFVHEQRLVHGCVTPDHVLIEPREHKLVLIGWCGATQFGQAPILIPQRWRGWANWNPAATPGTDLSAAARSMKYLLPQTIEPAIARHLERAAESSAEAWKLLNDFDRMIEALWGPRQFREFRALATLVWRPKPEKYP